MDLHILDLPGAVGHRPDKPTYAIRIFSSRQKRNDRFPLQDHPFYVQTVAYVFDDNDTHPIRMESGPAWMHEETAEEIITNFATYRNEVDSLLVHCGAGRNRSPAVAIALNELFDLGHDSDVLKQEYGEYNRFVYDKMMEFGRTHVFET